MPVTALLLYCALGLMVLTVISNRYWRSQIARSRITVLKLQEEMETLSKDLHDEAKACLTLGERFADAEQRTQRSEREAARVEAELEVMRQAATERYYVFDRLEPRSGRFWEAAVRRTPGPQRPGAAGPSWNGVRRYLLVADSERNARERVAARFASRTGYEVVELVPCRLTALTGASAVAVAPAGDGPDAAAPTAARRPRTPSGALPRRAATTGLREATGRG